MKPAGYPLPWCDFFDAPYWQVSVVIVAIIPEWGKWTRGKPMSEIIAEIDRMIAASKKVRRG